MGEPKMTEAERKLLTYAAQHPDGVVDDYGIAYERLLALQSRGLIEQGTRPKKEVEVADLVRQAKLEIDADWFWAWDLLDQARRLHLLGGSYAWFITEKGRQAVKDAE